MSESAIIGAKMKRYKDTLLTLQSISTWEKAAQGRSKWRGLINRRAALYEERRICEAERKHRQRKANWPPKPMGHQQIP